MYGTAWRTSSEVCLHLPKSKEIIISCAKLCLLLTLLAEYLISEDSAETADERTPEQIEQDRLFVLQQESKRVEQKLNEMRNLVLRGFDNPERLLKIHFYFLQRT